ncbi:MAG: hypothetical protein KC731_25470 [Myxococcales bacterium]|nr:hypothetical protein [Myxococcales bacterium]
MPVRPLRLSAIPFALLAASSLLGCNGAETPLAPGYPPRPHGTEEGDVFGYFEGDGYRAEEGSRALASEGSFSSLDMLDVKNTGPSHVLLHLAAMW